MKPIVVIPARGGSKGVPRKNIKPLAGKPLIHYTIEAAREVFPDNLILVSTDDVEIRTAVETIGLRVPFLRPSNLATDLADSYEVMLHAVTFAEGQGYFADALILLQPTSPFRTGNHIREAISLFNDTCDMVASVRETRSNPYYVLFEEDSNGYLQKSKTGTFTRRQDCPPVWELNGAIYVISVNALKTKRPSEFSRIRKFPMSEVPSHDIDSLLDWAVAEAILNDYRADQ